MYEYIINKCESVLRFIVSTVMSVEPVHAAVVGVVAATASLVASSAFATSDIA
jgi:hypothetical protein